jgi:hypothetical protein
VSVKAFIDRTAIRVASTLARNVRYFAEGVESRPLAELAPQVSIDLPDITGEGFYQAVGHCGDTEIQPALLVRRWQGWDAPLVMYHHGAAEGGWTFSFDRIFRRRALDSLSVNVVAICATSSQTNREFYTQIRTLAGYTALIAGSAAVAEAMVARHRSRSSAPVVLSGVSLGGVVSCLHAACFGTADGYAPLYAGPNLAEVFIASAYGPMCDESARTRHSDAIRRTLDFGPAFSAGPVERVFPVLGRFDSYFNLQTQSAYYRPENLTVTDQSHSSGATAFGFLRRHILETLEGAKHHVVTDRS